MRRKTYRFSVKQQMVKGASVNHDQIVKLGIVKTDCGKRVSPLECLATCLNNLSCAAVKLEANILSLSHLDLTGRQKEG